MDDPNDLFEDGKERSGMGHLGKIQSPDDLPSDKVLKLYIRQASKLIDKGVRIKKVASPSTVVAVEPPPELLKALKKNKAATATFNKLPPSHRKEYITWINEAKTIATREKRIATTMEWLSEGKSRNWKYENC
jgi:uncharacterized protein YdeI (YjbR/CyaY-like superfamily)